MEVTVEFLALLVVYYIPLMFQYFMDMRRVRNELEKISQLFYAIIMVLILGLFFIFTIFGVEQVFLKMLFIILTYSLIGSIYLGLNIFSPKTKGLNTGIMILFTLTIIVFIHKIFW